MARAIVFLFLVGGSAYAAPHEPTLEQGKEICALLDDLAAHLRAPLTRDEWASEAAFLDARVDYPVSLTELTVGTAPGAVTLGRRLFHSGDEQLGAGGELVLVPPPAFRETCRARAADLRSGAVVPTPLGGLVDYARGAPALASDGTTATVTWRHDGFPYFFAVVFRRAADGRFRLFAHQAWPAPAGS